MATTITIKDPTAPATEAQINFLKSLLGTREESAATKKAQFCFEAGAMTKGRASAFITEIKAQPWKKAPVAAPAAPVAAPVDITQLPTPEYGYYLTDEE